ncbi:hypothetical protein, partial [Ralstonia pseudosolanacearum]|uniref:hypothetical protein n=1 Tax=Ralstonia pseudosolanacearum TaxID=1310165 RepID=UPI003CE91094
MDASFKSKRSEGVVNTDDTEMTRVLASQGAMLLQSALDEKLTDVKSDENDIRRRKPLTDIGNTQTKSNAPRPNPRKKWKKSQIQIIPVPPPSTESESIETSIKTEKDVMENNVPLKLPRAMRSATSSNSTLKDKNSDRADEVVGKKTEGNVASPDHP